MKRLLPAVAILALLILPQAAWGQPDVSLQLRKVKEVYINLDDGVEDGCLPSPNVLIVESELILRRSGIAIREPKPGPLSAYGLQIGVIGSFTAGMGCIGGINFSFGRLEGLHDGTAGWVQAYERWGTVVAAKANFQGDLRNLVNQFTTELANQILKARGQ